MKGFGSCARTFSDFTDSIHGIKKLKCWLWGGANNLIFVNFWSLGPGKKSRATKKGSANKGQ